MTSLLQNIKRVIILRCGALGDLVYATSVIAALRMQYGEDTVIDFICTPGTAKLFEFDPRVNHVFHLKHKKLPIWLSPQKRAIINHSAQTPYDLLISLEFGKQFKSLIRHIHATHKTGMGILETNIDTTAMNRGQSTKLYYRNVIAEEILSTAKPSLLGAPYPALKKKFSLPENSIIIAPSNSHNQKKGLNYRAWPFEHWRSLIKTLSNHITVIIVGARGEEAFFDQIKPYPSTNIIDLVGLLSISELVSIVQNSQGVICTDSATGHIGAALNTPTFVLMGPNNPLTDAPYQNDTLSVHPLSLGLSCSPCYKTDTMRQCKVNICMQNITPKMVLETLTTYTFFKEFSEL